MLNPNLDSGWCGRAGDAFEQEATREREREAMRAMGGNVPETETLHLKPRQVVQALINIRQHSFAMNEHAVELFKNTMPPLEERLKDILNSAQAIVACTELLLAENVMDIPDSNLEFVRRKDHYE